MNKRVFGLIGIGAKMANWNAGFDGSPKRTQDGFIYGSDKALKYSMRNYWNSQGEKVFYFKRFKEREPKKAGDAAAISPLMLKEAFETFYETKLEPKKTSHRDVITRLFEARDVQNFGSAFAVEGFNLSIAGAVQIGQGFNLNLNALVNTESILSPFSNQESSGDAKGEAKSQSSVGKQIVLTEGHYVYPFSINPMNYQAYQDLLGIDNPYTQESYEQFKKGALHGATHLNTCSKMGCYNEFGLFIELKEGSVYALEPLDGLVRYSKTEDQVSFDFSRISERVKDIQDEVSRAVLYYNPYQVEVTGTEALEVKDLFTVR